MTGEAVSSQPAWVTSSPRHELPELVFETFDLTPFTRDGRFAHSVSQQQDFIREAYARWSRTPEYSDVPHILDIDFRGVEVAELRVVEETIGSLLRISRAREVRQFYLRLDGVGLADSLGPWNDIEEGLEKAELVVTARRKGQQEFDLIGDTDKKTRYAIAFNALIGERQWIDGGLFSRDVLHRRSTGLLNAMYADGVIIKRRHFSGPAYYHSLI